MGKKTSADGTQPEFTSAQIRAKDKLLRYLSDPENPFLTRAALSTEVLGYKRPEEIHRLFRPCQIAEIEKKALETRRLKYAGMLARVDIGLFKAAENGDAAACKLAYQRFEAWSEKLRTESDGKIILEVVYEKSRKIDEGDQ